MKLDKAVFLDFDGVLFDTVKEAYAVCLFATNKIREDKDVDFDSEDFKIFKKYRYLIGPAWNYFYLLKIIEEIRDMDTFNFEQKYSIHISMANECDYKPFERKFFANREHLKRNHEDFWFSLNTPYDFLFGLSDLINRHPHNFFIVTTKDTDTILKLLRTNELYFKPVNIYDGFDFERSKTKGNIIKNIMQKHSIKSAIFVDDNISHISDCKSLSGLKLFHARWGYTLPTDNASQEGQVLFNIRELLKGD